MMRVKERRGSDLRDWVQEGLVQEHRTVEGNPGSRKEQELSFEHTEFSHPERPTGDVRSLAQRGGLD